MVMSACGAAFVGGRVQAADSRNSGLQSPFSSSGEWLFSGAPTFQDVPTHGQPSAPKPTSSASGPCGDKQDDATPPKGLGGAALSLKHALQNVKEAVSAKREAEKHLRKAKVLSREIPPPRGLFSALRRQVSGQRSSDSRPTLTDVNQNS